MYDITAKSPDNVSYIFSTPRFLVTFVGYWSALILYVVLHQPSVHLTLQVLPSTWGVACYTKKPAIEPSTPQVCKTTAFHTERQPLISYDQSSETNDELTASVPILETENSF